jgi:hypothetical protein
MASSYNRGDPGHEEGGVSQVVTPSGATYTVRTTTRTRIPPLTWSHVTAARAREYSEADGVRSWERLIRDCVRGGSAAFLPGCQVRVYWDADAANYITIRPLAPDDTACPAADASWRGLYAVSIEGWAA